MKVYKRLSDLNLSHFFHPHDIEWHFEGVDQTIALTLMNHKVLSMADICVTMFGEFYDKEVEQTRADVIAKFIPVTQSEGATPTLDGYPEDFCETCKAFNRHNVSDFKKTGAGWVCLTCADEGDCISEEGG